MFEKIKLEKPELFKGQGEYPLLHLDGNAIRIRYGNAYYFHVYLGNIIAFEVSQNGFSNARRIDASCESLPHNKIEGIIGGMNEALIRYCNHHFPGTKLGQISKIQ